MVTISYIAKIYRHVITIIVEFELWNYFIFIFETWIQNFKQNQSLWMLWQKL